VGIACRAERTAMTGLATHHRRWPVPRPSDPANLQEPGETVCRILQISKLLLKCFKLLLSFSWHADISFWNSLLGQICLYEAAHIVGLSYLHGRWPCDNCYIWHPFSRLLLTGAQHILHPFEAKDTRSCSKGKLNFQPSPTNVSGGYF